MFSALRFIYRISPMPLKKIISFMYSRKPGLYIKFILKNAIRKLAVESNRCNSISEYIDLAYKYRYFGLSIRPEQIKEEIQGLLNMLAEIKPKTILEIGTARGGTLFLLTKVAHEAAHIISIDLPGGLFGGGYNKAIKPLYESFSRPLQRIDLLRMDSHNHDTQIRVEQLLGIRQIDLLFIDGDHTYQGVKRDFEIYSQYVRSGGMIVFHDIAVHQSNTGCEVNKFWGEVKKHYKHSEIMANPSQNWAGIGVIYAP